MSSEEKDFDVLPVLEHKELILDSIAKNQIIICIGETGSGKTTQIPQICSCSASAPYGRMAVTQPRRVAAITVAQRVAQERGSRIGTDVGYSVRFEDRSCASTKVKFMTDGILVRECMTSPHLKDYDVVMLDEAHERSVHTDILFGLVKQAAKSRPDLRVIIASATLNSDRFCKYFNSCPVLNIPGRIFPVDIYHSALKQNMTVSGPSLPSTATYLAAAVKLVMQIHDKVDQGHILVFLTGQDAIEQACRMIRDEIAGTVPGVSSKPNTNRDGDSSESRGPYRHHCDYQLLVLPLFASLPIEEQKRVFSKVTATGGRHGRYEYTRKVIISTNIAETSVTVPQVRYVIDCGYVKQKTYDPERHLESLIVVPISQISAQQRAGRAGRTGPGQCYRLYSSVCYDAMMYETVPEIKRSNIEHVVLYLKVLGIQDVLGFDYFEAPSEEQLVEALISLHRLGAIDSGGAVTPLGKKMSAFPVEPCLARMLLEASAHPCARVGTSTSTSGVAALNTAPGGEEAGGSIRYSEDAYFMADAIVMVAMTTVDNVLVPKRPTGSAGAGGDSGSRPSGGGRLSLAMKESAFSGPRSSSGHRRGRPGVQIDLQTEDEERQREEAHRRLMHPMGDAFTGLGIYKQYLRSGQSNRWCGDNFIQNRAMVQCRNICCQLAAECIRSGLCGKEVASLVEETPSAPVERTEKCRRQHEQRLQEVLLSGLFMNAARLCSSGGGLLAARALYRSLPLVTRGGLDFGGGDGSSGDQLAMFRIHPSCSLGAQRAPDCVMYQELVHSGGQLHVKAVTSVPFERLVLYRREHSSQTSVAQLRGLSDSDQQSVGTSNSNRRKRSHSESISNNSNSCSSSDPTQARTTSVPLSAIVSTDVAVAVTGSSTPASLSESRINDAKMRFLARKK